MASPREYPERPVVGVGGVVIEQGRALLIRRGGEPLKGQWSIPGGTLETGETLEEGTRREMQEELLNLWDQSRFTVLFVTHSIEEAIIIGSRILVLSPHPGRVRAELDASRFRFDDVDSPEFGALAKRIHRLLFE